MPNASTGKIRVNVKRGLDGRCARAESESECLRRQDHEEAHERQNFADEAPCEEEDIVDMSLDEESRRDVVGKNTKRGCDKKPSIP